MEEPRTFASFEQWYAELKRLCQHHIGLDWENEWGHWPVRERYEAGAAPKDLIDDVIRRYDLDDLAAPYMLHWTPPAVPSDE